MNIHRWRLFNIELFAKQWPSSRLHALAKVTSRLEVLVYDCLAKRSTWDLKVRK